VSSRATTTHTAYAKEHPAAVKAAFSLPAAWEDVRMLVTCTESQISMEGSTRNELQEADYQATTAHLGLASRFGHAVSTQNIVQTNPVFPGWLDTTANVIP
jgi:hypothetical protein